MPLFKFKVADAEGRARVVLTEGETPADAANRLRGRGSLPLECLGDAGAEPAAAGGLWRRRTFDVCDFTVRLEPLLRAHIPLERALGIIAEGMDEPDDRHVVAELRRGLHEGKAFSALLRSQAGRFPPLYANLVEAGEQAGALAEVMVELRRYLEESRELRGFLVTSSIYPAIVVSVTFAVLVLLFTVFIPRFTRIFTDMGKPLPFLLGLLSGFSHAVIALWWLWLLLIAAAALGVAAVRRGGRARVWWDGVMLRLPLVGGLVRASEISRFWRTLAVLAKHHVHLLTTVQMATRSLHNSVLAASLHGLASELRAGTRLSTALASSPHLPKTALQMLAIGEETGRVGEMLDQVAGYAEARLRQQVRRLLALFEPAVILFLAVVVLLVVISIFTAILQMNQI